MKQVVRWVLLAMVIVGMVEIPRGVVPPAGETRVTAPIQYFSWGAYCHNLSDLAHRMITLSPGMNANQTMPVSEVVWSGIGSSLTLVAVGLGFALILGVWKGIYDGIHVVSPRRFITVSNGLQWLAESLPDVFLIISLELMGFFLQRQGYPVYFVGSHQLWTGTIVPAFMISVIPMMYISRMVRMSVEDQLGQQYLVTAQAKGLRRSYIMYKHLLPNLMPTVLNSLVNVVGLLFSNLVIVEYLFARDGIVAKLLYAIGYNGSDVIYLPQGDPMNAITYNAYDPQVTLACLVVCVLLFLLARVIVSGVLRAFGYRGQTNRYSSALRDNPSSRRIPWQLTAGAAVMLFILVIGACANWLPLVDPNHRDVVQFDPNSSDMSTPPYPPSWHHLFGTDSLGRDLLSRSIHAILPTFGYVAGVVVVICVLSAILAVASSVFRIPGVRQIIGFWHDLFGVIPGVMAALLILEIPDIYWLGAKSRPDHIDWPAYHMFIYLGVIVLIEASRVAAQLQSTLDDAGRTTYMEAAEVAGNSAFTAFLIHHARSLTNALMEHGVISFSRVLLLIVTLGFFQNPIHQSFHTGYANGGWQLTWLYTPNTLDWSGLIADNARDFLGYTWILFGPVFCVGVTIVGMNLILSGLRRITQSVPAIPRSRPSLALRVISKLKAKPVQGGTGRTVRV